MEFDKSRVYTALNADELKVGSKVVLADDLANLKYCVEHNNKDDIIDILVEIRSEAHDCRFANECTAWALAYLVSEPEEKKLKWTDLKVGDVITNGKFIAMVTEIDKECSDNAHVYAGNMWLYDDELVEWEKVEDYDDKD